MHWHRAPVVAVGLRPAAVGEGTPAPVAGSEQAVGLRPAAGGVIHCYQAPTVAAGLRPAAGGERQSGSGPLTQAWRRGPRLAAGSVKYSLEVTTVAV